MLSTLDLCSGVGGVTLAFSNAGFKTTFACDINPKVKATYDLNFDKPKLVVDDIFSISPSFYPDFDVLLAGFPCQSFSVSGKRLGFKEEGRGTVFFQLAEILRIRKPKAFLFENVKGLVGHDDGHTFQTIQDVLKSLGYHVHYKVLNSKNFGVPQNRERIFIVGFQDEVDFKFPENLPTTPDIREILETDVDKEYFITPEHKHYNAIIEGVTREDTVFQWRRSYIRENKRGVCPTITASLGGVLTLVKTKDGVRKLTPRELFRAQGFPDSYQLPDASYATLHHQAGNSVTVPVVEAIAREMMKVLG
jgi:DNA (cytosine-5)-methyltransferase 1